MTNNVNKRTFLNLDYVQGEDIELEFSITEDGTALPLDEYTFSGSLFEDFNEVAVATFVFAENTDNSNWVASLDTLTTTGLAVQVYKYEIRMERMDDGKTSTLLYGTLTLRKARV